MAFKYLNIPIQPDQRSHFDTGGIIEKSIPTSWGLQPCDRLTWYYGKDSGIAEVVRVLEKSGDFQPCFVRRVC